MPTIKPFELNVTWIDRQYPAGVDSLVRGLLSIESSAIRASEIEKIPSHLVMVLDISGSMNVQNKYPFLRQALEAMLNNLEENGSVNNFV